MFELMQIKKNLLLHYQASSRETWEIVLMSKGPYLEYMKFMAKGLYFLMLGLGSIVMLKMDFKIIWKLRICTLHKPVAGNWMLITVSIDYKKSWKILLNPWPNERLESYSVSGEGLTQPQFLIYNECALILIKIPKRRSTQSCYTLLACFTIYSLYDTIRFSQGMMYLICTFYKTILSFIYILFSLVLFLI